MSPNDSMRTRRSFLKVSGQATVLLSAGSWLAACGGSSSSAPARQRALVMGYPSVPSQLDPTTFSGTDSMIAVGNVYATPLQYVRKDLGKGFPEVPVEDPRVEPLLAKSFEAGSNGKTFRLVLRDDVFSGAGNPLSAEDVRWTVERNIAIPGNGQIIVRTAGLEDLRRVVVVDDHTVEFRLDEPNRLFPQLLQNQFGFGIVDAVEAKKHVTPKDKYAVAWLSRNTAGFGPYLVSSFTTQRMELGASPKRVPAPTYKAVRWLAVPEPSNRLNLISSGDVQVITELQPEQLRALKGRASVKTYATSENAQSDQLYFNLSVPELKDPRVRQALAYAIPSKGILDAVYRGTATAWETPMGGSQYRGADKSLNPFTEDTAKAKALLKAAGATDLKLKINFDTSSFWQSPAAIQLQTAWRSVGVETELEGLSPSVWGERLGKKQMPVFMATVSWQIPDFFYVMNLLFKTGSGINWTGYSSKKADALIDAGLEEADATKRDALAKEFQQLYFEDLPAVTLANRDSVTAIDSGVTGFEAWMNGMIYWAGLKPAAA